jgi:hypothetical protein
MEFAGAAADPGRRRQREGAARRSAGIADGTILSVLAGPAYVRWARGLVGPDDRLTTFALYAIDRDGDRARWCGVPGIDAERVASLTAREVAPRLTR